MPTLVHSTASKREIMLREIDGPVSIRAAHQLDPSIHGITMGDDDFCVVSPHPIGTREKRGVNYVSGEETSVRATGHRSVAVKENHGVISTGKNNVINGKASSDHVSEATLLYVRPNVTVYGAELLIAPSLSPEAKETGVVLDMT